MLVAGALLIFGPAAGRVCASVLTFDFPPAGVTTINQAYGDNITATTMGSFSYGVGPEGFTPNVVTDYVANAPSGLTRWPTDYSDLVNVLEYEPDGQGPFNVVFTADPGFLVTLHSFDLGAWFRTDHTLPSYQILTGNTVLFTQTNVHVEGNSGHTSIVFGNPFFAPTLTIRINQQTLGGASDNIGIDNIRFGQILPTSTAVPEPSSLTLFSLCGLAIAWTARRRFVHR